MKAIGVLLGSVLALAQEPGAIRILGDCALTGATYRKVEVAGARLRACESLCDEDEGCSAFTVSPKPGGSGWTCDLKRAVGTERHNQLGFTSGIKMQAAAPVDPPIGAPPPREVVQVQEGQGLPPDIAKLIRERFEGRGGGAEVVMRPIPTEIRTPTPRGEASAPGRVEPPEPVAPVAPVTTRIPPQFAGDWTFTVGGVAQTVVITQSGDKLTFRDSANREAEGRVSGQKVTVESWGAEAVHDPYRYELKWSNGSVWTKK